MALRMSPSNSGFGVHDLVDVCRELLGGGFVAGAPGRAQAADRLFFARVANDDLARIAGDAFDVARLQPLAGEILRETVGARIGEHAS